MRNGLGAGSSAYDDARDCYGEKSVDTDTALARLATVAVSLHCWQGDDVAGFENSAATMGGGLAVTGTYPGRARNGDELRSDLERALSLIPGRHRVNLHAMYAETGGRKVERNELTAEHFGRWIDWAKTQNLRLDFNPTFFAHALASDGFTLAHRDPAVRRFWIEHGIACRRIGAEFGRQLGSACVTNVWIPDGCKDTPADRKSPRERLAASLDEVFAEPHDPRHLLDAVEGKLFGIGSESYVVGSHEFYLGYAITRRKLLCVDTGHFHPTESAADKISALFCHLDRLLLHVSRGVRWDSDHVVTLGDDLLALAQELVRGGYLARTHLGLDYFDASINRVAAWVIGARAFLKALLAALLEPIDALVACEAAGNFTGRLALLEEQKTMPLGAVWDFYCESCEVPRDGAWLPEVQRYERDVQCART